jgi:hypothetical protein
VKKVASKFALSSVSIQLGGEHELVKERVLFMSSVLTFSVRNITSRGTRVTMVTGDPSSLQSVVFL